MTGLLQYDSNHYEVMDTALDEALEKLKNKSHCLICILYHRKINCMGIR